MTERLAPPTTSQILAARQMAKHTQEEAGQTVHSNGRRWRDWESGRVHMSPATWELYLLRTQAVIFTEPKLLERMPPVTVRK